PGTLSPAVRAAQSCKRDLGPVRAIWHGLTSGLDEGAINAPIRFAPVLPARHFRATFGFRGYRPSWQLDACGRRTASRETHHFHSTEETRPDARRDAVRAAGPRSGANVRRARAAAGVRRIDRFVRARRSEAGDVARRTARGIAHRGPARGAALGGAPGSGVLLTISRCPGQRACRRASAIDRAHGAGQG